MNADDIWNVSSSRMADILNIITFQYAHTARLLQFVHICERELLLSFVDLLCELHIHTPAVSRGATNRSIVKLSKGSHLYVCQQLLDSVNAFEDISKNVHWHQFLTSTVVL